MKGIAGVDLPNGSRYIALHYSADPEKTEEWARAEEPNPGATWKRQMDLYENVVEGALFDVGWFNLIDRLPRLTRWVRYWDLATTVRTAGDYTAGALIGFGENGRVIIADVKRWKREWPDTRDGTRNENGEIVDKGILQITADDIALIESMYDPRLGEKRPAYHVGVESQGMQLALVQDLARNELFLRVPFWPENASGKGDKKQRASTWAARARQGLVDVVKGPWVAPFIDEMRVFDGMGLNHDDQADAVSGAVELGYARMGGPVESKPPPAPNTWDMWQAIQKSAAKRR